MPGRCIFGKANDCEAADERDGGTGRGSTSTRASLGSASPEAIQGTSPTSSSVARSRRASTNCVSSGTREARTKRVIQRVVAAISPSSSVSGVPSGVW